MKRILLLSLLIFCLGLSFNFPGVGGGDQPDFPNVYIDEGCAGTKVGSQANPYDDLSDINWTTGGDNSIFDYLAGAPAASPTIHLKRGDTWAEQMTVGCSGTATYPIVVTAYGTGANPIITGGTYAVLITDFNYITFNQICFEGVANPNPLGALTGTTSYVNFHYCVFKNGKGATGKGVESIGATNLQFYNCVIANFHQYGLHIRGGSTADIQNCIISGCGLPQMGFGLYVTGATATYDYNVILGNNRYPTFNISGGTDGGHNLTVFPKFTSGYGQSYVVISCDDDDVDYWDALAAAIPAGVPLTFFTTAGNVTVGEQANLVALDAAGHEIAVHGWSHSDLTKTDAIAITSTNTNPTCDVDIATTTITLSCDEGGNIVAYDWSGDKNITELKAAVVGKGWKLDSLDDTAGAQAVPYTCTLDVTAPDYAFWREEIADTMTWIDSVVGGTITVMATPYSTISDNLIAYMKDVAGITGNARGETATNSMELESINIYKLYRTYLTNIKGAGTQAAVEYAARHVAAAAMYGNGIYICLTHNTGEFSPTQMGWFVNELIACGVTPVTFGSAVASIRADHATADDITYTKAYTDAWDFTLQPNSPCIDAGVDVGLTQDYVGNLVPALKIISDVILSPILDPIIDPIQNVIFSSTTKTAVDIGAYEYQY